jgi:hypothetical protein
MQAVGFQEASDASVFEESVSPSFGSQIAAPMGRYDSIVSAISGKALIYFTPATLTELVHRCAPQSFERPWGFASTDRNQALILIRPASWTGSGQSVDGEQARRLCRQWLRPQIWNTPRELIDLARVISPRVQGLREEIAFVGAASASQAAHLFAPPSVLPAALDDLAIALTQCTADATALTALTGFFAINLHPFVDGNGRWGRQLALAAGMRADPRAALTTTVFLSVQNQMLCDYVWPMARRSGAVEYLSAAYSFERNLLRTLDGQPALGAVLTGINEALRRAAHGSRALYEELLTELYAAGRLSLSSVRTRCGLSMRAAQGLAQRLAESSDSGLARVAGDYLDIHASFEMAHRAVDAACSEIWSKPFNHGT